MEKERVLWDLDASTQTLMESLGTFTNETFNRKPSAGEWSAGEVAEHLLLVERAARKAVCAEGVPTTRPPQSKLPLMQEALADNQTRRKAPPTVWPMEGHKECQSLMEAIRSQRHRMRKGIEESDLTEACLSYKHPSLGVLTRVEWVYFTIWHAARHIGQLQRLRTMA